MTTHDNNHTGKGTVVSVRGSVVDAHFAQHLPGRFNLLRAGENQEIAVEVLTYLDGQTVRGIALTSTQGPWTRPARIDPGRPANRQDRDCPGCDHQSAR